MQIARLEAQIKRDMRMLRLAIECRLRRAAIIASRHSHEHVTIACSKASWSVLMGGYRCDLGRLDALITRLRQEYGLRVMPEFYAFYRDGEHIPDPRPRDVAPE